MILYAPQRGFLNDDDDDNDDGCIVGGSSFLVCTVLHVVGWWSRILIDFVLTSLSVSYIVQIYVSCPSLWVCV